jgi:hypothetical protein
LAIDPTSITSELPFFPAFYVIIDDCVPRMAASFWRLPIAGATSGAAADAGFLLVLFYVYATPVAFFSKSCMNDYVP